MRKRWKEPEWDDDWEEEYESPKRPTRPPRRPQREPEWEEKWKEEEWEESDAWIEDEENDWQAPHPRNYKYEDDYEDERPRRKHPHPRDFSNPAQTHKIRRRPEYNPYQEYEDYPQQPKIKPKLKRPKNKNKPKPKLKQPSNKLPKLKMAKVGIRRKTNWFCWLLLLSSFSFAVYKNFTAIDKHTIHERSVVTTKTADTTAIKTFVTDFAQTYYTWKPEHSTLDQRQTKLKNYFTNGLVALNTDAIRSDIPTESKVKQVKIWQIKPQSKNTHKVTFTVEQSIKNHQKENDKTKNVEATYSVEVYQNQQQDLVIIKSPTIAAAPAKAKYNDKLIDTDLSVNGDTADSATKFLMTFFKIYPKSSPNELKYYTKEKLHPIKKDYRFVELLNPIYHKQGNHLKAEITVKYLDPDTDLTQFSQYTLVLKKSEHNWIIDSGL